jgi:hypothetical protein
MWPFKKRQEAPSTLMERLETLERQARSLETDWLEFEDRVKRKVWRDAKRAQRDGEAAPPDDQVATPAAPQPMGQDEISAAIRRRRGVRVVRESM